MIYTPLIQASINFAIKVHELDSKQKRKGKDVPYITHTMAVGLILARVTKDENVISAGILHDTIEDCEPYGSITESHLIEKFNKDIARMVNDVTEQDKTLPWMERKMAALEHIKVMQKDSLLVKSADVLHNLVEIVEDVRVDGDSVFDKFNASKEDTLTRYIRLIPEIEKAWPENPLLGDLKFGLENLLNAAQPYF